MTMENSKNRKFQLEDELQGWSGAELILLIVYIYYKPYFLRAPNPQAKLNYEKNQIEYQKFAKGFSEATKQKVIQFSRRYATAKIDFFDTVKEIAKQNPNLKRALILL